MADRSPSISLHRGIGILLVALGVLAGAGPLSDASFFTHLATGRIIWETGVPRVDPYTFTAAGRTWVVQSWGASFLYAGLEKVGGLVAIRLLTAAISGAVAAAIWALTRSARTTTPRLLLAVPAVAIGLDGWSERPLMLGLLCLAVLLLAAEGQVDARWLLPVGWLWVNTHGSWPLGVVLIVLLALGRRLDGEHPAVELRAAVWLAAGVVASVANPYGVRLLVFPVELLGHREALATVVEWQRPAFERWSERLFALLLLVAVGAVVRRRRWRATLPLVVFAGLALTGSRNVLPASLVLLPGASTALAGLGTLQGAGPHRLARPLAATGVALAACALVVAATGDALDDRPFPIAADRWLREHDLAPAEHRIIAREVVGNWWELRNGPTGTVFIDDRIEVLPTQVVLDGVLLLEGDPSSLEVLDRYDPDAVLWEADAPLAELLAGDPRWEIAYRDDRFVVAVPVG